MKLYNLLLILFLFCIVFQNCSDSSDNKIVLKEENANDTVQILQAILDTFQQSKNANNINPFSPFKDTLIICYDSLYFTPLRHFKKGKYLFLTEDQICNIVTNMERKRVFRPFSKLLKIPEYQKSVPFKNTHNHYTIFVDFFVVGPNFYPDGKPCMMINGELYKGKEKCSSYTTLTLGIDMMIDENGKIYFLKTGRSYY